MRMLGPGLEFRRQEKVLAPELPGSIAEATAEQSGAGGAFVAVLSARTPPGPKAPGRDPELSSRRFRRRRRARAEKR